MKTWIVIILTSVVSTFAYADQARDIMDKANNRNDGASQYSLQTIATCKYTIQNNQLKCSERPRVKVMESVQLDVGKNNKDSKSLMVIQKPAAEYGIGFLQFDYDEQGRDSDQWMYLSALGKIKRIVSGNDDEPKTGTLFGSEVGYEDVERRHLDDFVYKIVKEEKQQGRDCWVIESVPKPTYARKSNYSRSLSWIDKERYMIIKAKMFDRRGRLAKQMNQSDFFQQDGIWLARKLNMNNVQSKRITTMKSTKVLVNVAVADDLLSQRSLTDGAFREQKLQSMRERTK
ncbi:MAG: outer membrane lipoprotein-sorting protein [Gammaproteobacteria bacterium]|nr:outer membrane lipoprotein-sorting protein [Gammaproteobacteria bacterium]